MNFFSDLWRQAHLAPAFQAIVITALALGVIASIACLALVLHHGGSSMRRRRRGRLVDQAMPFLAPRIATGDRLKEAVAESRQEYGDWATAIVLREARREIRGERAQELSNALVEMGEVERLTRLARSRQDWRRAQAVRELGQCGGSAAQASLLEATKDKSPEVRRAARDGLIFDGRPESIQAAIQSYLADAPSGTAFKRSFYARLAAASAEDL